MYYCPSACTSLTPAQLFVSLHAFDRDGSAVPVKRVVEAANMCHEQKAAFTQDVMARALQQVCSCPFIKLQFSVGPVRDVFNSV